MARNAAKSTAKSTAKSKANGHGGRRAGAGRKPKAVNVLKAEAQAVAAGRLNSETPNLIANLLYLANGGYEQVTETWEPAGQQTIDSIETDQDGKARVDANGRPIWVSKPLYPDLPQDKLVCIKRVVEVAAPDRLANIDLLNRIIGRPAQAIEIKDQADPQQLPAALEKAFLKIYGAKAG